MADRVKELEARVRRLERENDDLEASRDAMRTAATASARTAELAISRLLSMKEIADAAVAWWEDPATTSRSDAEARLWKLIDLYRIEVAKRS